jgi:hypothetical protein
MGCIDVVAPGLKSIHGRTGICSSLLRKNPDRRKLDLTRADEIGRSDSPRRRKPGKLEHSFDEGRLEASSQLLGPAPLDLPVSRKQARRRGAFCIGFTPPLLTTASVSEGDKAWFAEASFRPALPQGLSRYFSSSL